MKKFVYWVPAFIWIAVIYYSSSTPYEKQDIKPWLGDWVNFSWAGPYLERISFTYNNQEVSVAAQGIAGFIEFFIRKGAHIGVFFVLALLIYFALFYTVQQNKNKPLLAASAWAGTVLYAVFDEWHQGLTPNRTPYAGDVLLDAFGGGLAVFVILSVHRKNGRKKKFNIE
ncbi:VanZ family protein [Halobacillus sp. Marseille-P3879]|uniref:VanZ family protein n=1 Tax=Halobacillus sp. Marseille-P3879 TaxID=2045014 RepID=UPI000C7C70B6|nr:VanZ family protein [Halobacillus sp. Marseille-P3879]